MSSAKACTFLPLGAIIQKFLVKERNIVLGFPTAELYQQHNSAYFGETVGRIANRVSNAKINHLNGKSYPLAANNGPNALHGGNVGWGKREFEGPFSVNRNGNDATFFKYISPDGEEGYPGTVEVRIWYVQEREEVQGVQQEVLHVEYEAELVGDEVDETAINMTGHSYFNLSDRSTIAGTEVSLITNKYQVTNDVGIPTGSIEEHSSFTPQTIFTLGQTEPDIDNCFIVNADPSGVPIDSRSSPLQKIASFHHPETKMHLEISTTEPAFQFYTGKFIDVPAVEGTPARGARSGFAIEPSRYINAVNVPEHRSMVVLKKGEKYGLTIIYRSWQA